MSAPILRAEPTSRMFVTMNDGSSALLRFVAWAEHRDVPRLGWPASFLPPPRVHVRTAERGTILDVFVTADGIDTEYLARLDLVTREVLGSPRGAEHRRLRRLALKYVADRNDFDRRCGIDTTPEPPNFILDDFNTWSTLQDMALFTDSLWFPPDPRPGRSSRLQWHSLARRVNEKIAHRPPRPSAPNEGTDWLF